MPKKHNNSRWISGFTIVFTSLTVLCSINSNGDIAILKVLVSRLPLTSFSVSFIMIGYILFYYHTDIWSKEKTILLIVLAWFCFVINSLVTDTIAIDGVVNYSLGLIFFAVFCQYGKKESFEISKFRFINFVADISYPLYIVHGINGYIIMTIMSRNGISPGLCLVIAIVVVGFIAWIIHRYIEVPLLNYTKKILKK